MIPSQAHGAHVLKVYFDATVNGETITSNEYLVSIDEQAEDMFFRLVKEYADRQGVTEQLKAENQLLWVGRMNNIRVCVREIVNSEMIYI